MTHSVAAAAIASQFLQNNSNYGTFREGKFCSKTRIMACNDILFSAEKGVKPFLGVQS